MAFKDGSKWNRRYMSLLKKKSFKNLLKISNNLLKKFSIPENKNISNYNLNIKIKYNKL